MVQLEARAVIDARLVRQYAPQPVADFEVALHEIRPRAGSGALIGSIRVRIPGFLRPRVPGFLRRNRRSSMLTLAELISDVTAQLRQAEAEAPRDSGVMQFKECELELAVSIEAEGRAGVRVYVVELGGGVTRASSNTIKVRFSSLPDRPVIVPGLSEVPPTPPPEGGSRPTTAP